MKNNNLKLNKNNQSGYAILFTVVIVSVISIIAIGLSNTAYKSMILSSVAKDSQTAFYQSDTATECALYADTNPDVLSGNNFKCGLDENDQTITLDITSSTNNY